MDSVGVGDGTMLSRQITDFTSLRRGRIASNDLTTLVRIQMCHCAIAVSVGRDRLVVNVIGEGTNDILETLEADRDSNTGTVTVGSERDLSGHCTVTKDGGIAIGDLLVH